MEQRMIRSLFLISAAVLVILVAACGPAHQLKSVMGPADAPLFTSLLGAPIPGVSGEAAWARRVGEANQALSTGQAREARARLADAVATLPADAPACEVRGALLYLQGLAAKLSGADGDDASWETLSTTCPEVALFTDLWTWMESPGAVPTADLAATLLAAQSLDRDRSGILQAVVAYVERAAHRKVDPCDQTFGPRKRQDLKEMSGALEDLGRPDLAMFGHLRGLVVDRRVVPGALAELAAWADAPAHRWLRREALGRALGGLSRRADWVDPLHTVPLCERYFADLLAEIEGDRGDGMSARHASRLVAAWAAAAVCLDRAPVRVLTDRVISAAGGAEPMVVLEALGGLAGQITLTALEGRAGDLATLLGEVAGALRRLREGLGNTREDRILHASLGVFAGAAELFGGRADLALKEVSTAVDLLDHLAATPAAEGASDIERLAPAFRGGSLVALALLQWLTDQGALAAGTLQRLDATLEGDLSALFQVLDAPDHSAAITRILRGVTKTIAKDWPGATAALDAATAPSPAETGWWAVGLDAGRMVAWDLLAILAWKEAPEVGKAALPKAEAVARRLVDDALAHFQVQGTGWELLTVLPLAHEVIPGFLLDETDWPAILKDFARAVEPALEKALAKVAPRGDAAPGFTDLLVDILRDATEVGLDTLVDQGKDALPRLADLLEARVDAYQGELRFILGMLAGVARFYVSPAEAAARFEATHADAPEPMAGVAWMPYLLDAALRLRVADSPETALAPLDEVIGLGMRAVACDVDDPVHALLPARMWLREVVGETAGAKEDYQTFRRMTARGFSGYATLSCRLNSQRGSLSVNAQLGQSLGALFTPVGAEGSFNVGAGWTSVAQDVDDVGCWAAVSPGPRDDAILHAHLAAAFYAMRRGDDLAAHRALADAVSAGRRLLNGDKAILGATGAGTVYAARKAVALDLVAWVSFTARLRGHISAADHLLDQSTALLAFRKTTWDEVLPADQELPIFLARLPDLPPIGPHVRAWHLAKDHVGRVAALKALEKDRAVKKAALLPRWGIRLVRELQEVSAAKTAGTPVPALSGPPKGAHAVAVVDAWTWIVALWAAPMTFSLQDFIAHADALCAAGLYREAVGIAATVVALVRGTQLAAMSQPVFAAVADRIPRDTYPVTRAAVLNELAPALMRSGDLMMALVAHRELVPVLSGRVGQRIELENRLALVNLLGAAELVPELTTEVRVLLPMLERRYGRAEEVFHSLLSVDVALGVFQDLDVPPDAALAALVAGADAVKGAGPAKQFFRILAKTADLEVRRQVSAAYLHFMFKNGPPLKEETPAPAQSEPGA
jgi:hypothetical protein